MKAHSVWIGFDSREGLAFAVARETIRRHDPYIPIKGLVLGKLMEDGLYHRPMEFRTGKENSRILWDVISDAPMSTQFAITRFLVPHLAKEGWALFIDCDMLVKANISDLFHLVDNPKNDKFAVMCVKHDYKPTEKTKMDGQVQTVYPRKNWSSVMLFNCDHPSNKKLTLEMINSVPGRDLHRFCWLEDDEIGELDQCWNYLVGHSSSEIKPKIVHFTAGGPWMRGYEGVPFADEWRQEVNKWAI